MVGGGRLSPELVAAMHRASDGWAAGLVLMREHLGRNGNDVSEALPEGKDAVFEYFTGEIFNRAKPNNQRTLMLAALLPGVTERDALALSGDADAPPRARLPVSPSSVHRSPPHGRRAGLPVPCAVPRVPARGGTEAAFRRRAPRGDGSRRQPARRARRLRFRSGAVPRIAGLAGARRPRAAHGGVPARRRTRQHAGRLGRCAARGARARASRASRCIWASRSCTPIPRARRSCWTRAYEGFVANGDLRRVLMTAAHAVECHYYEWADFQPLDRWITVFERHLEGGFEFTAAYDALRVWSSFLIALLFRQPEHPRIAEVAAEVERLIGDDAALAVPLNFRLSAASILFNYYNWKTKGDTADPLIARVTPWLSDPHASPREPGVVARAPRVQPPDPRPLRAPPSARWTRPRPSRARTGCARSCSRSTTRKSRRSRRPTTCRRRSPRSTSCARCSIHRGGWTWRTSSSRSRPCGWWRAARTRPRRRRPRP